MHVFVGHWKKLVERKNYLEPILNALFDDITWIDWHDSDTLNIKDYELYKIQDPFADKKYICNALDIIHTLKFCIEKNENCLFLEDDVVIFNSIKNFSLKEVPQNWDMIFLGGAVQKPSFFLKKNAYNYYKKLPQYMIKNNNIDFKYIAKPQPPYFYEDKFYWIEGGSHKYYSEKITDNIYKMYSSRCTDSWLISPEGAKKIMKYIFPLEVPFDRFLGDIIEKNKLNVYWLENNLTTQGSEIGKYDSSLKHNVNTHRLISQENFMKCCHHAFYPEKSKNLDPTKLKENESIYIKTDYLNIFIKALPLIKTSFILVTGSSDYNIPGSYITQEMVDTICNNNNLKYWYAQNVNCFHKKLKCIPIGFADDHWPHGYKKPINYYFNNTFKKTKDIYVNFDSNTNIDRKCALNTFKIENKSKGSVNSGKNLSFKDYLNDMKDYRYVLSPQGNGIDSHRTWEALLVGSVPIIKIPPFIKPLYEKLPIIIQEEWNVEEINLIENNLIQKNMLNSIFDTNYWLNN